MVTVKIKRGDEQVELKATLDKRPASSARADFQNRMGSELSGRRTGFPVFLQHDTVIKPIDCGGPLVDLDGKVIGVNIARAGRVESYAIPSEAVLPLMYDLMSGKLAPKEVKETPPAKPLTPAEKLAEAKAAFEKAQAERDAADKKLADAKAALDKAEAEAKAEKEKKPEEKKPEK
jgi:serine protease Do